MDRTEYLQMCKEVSLLESRYNIKQNVPPYELSFNKGETKHKAILHDLKANSIICADLSRVDKYDARS